MAIHGGNNINIISSNFTNNNIEDESCLYLENVQNINLHQVRFENNNGNLGPLVLINTSLSVDITGCNFENNEAYQHGGAIVMTQEEVSDHLELIISGSYFVNNRAPQG